MSSHFDRDIEYFFNRKESKNHGDQGIIVGTSPQSQHRIMIVDDVITDGRTKKESLKMLQKLSSAQLTGVVIAVDRMESTTEGKDARAQFEKDTELPVRAIVTIEEICQHLLGREIEGTVYLTKETFRRIEAYRQQYQVRSP